MNRSLSWFSSTRGPNASKEEEEAAALLLRLSLLLLPSLSAEDRFVAVAEEEDSRKRCTAWTPRARRRAHPLRAQSAISVRFDVRMASAGVFAGHLRAHVALAVVAPGGGVPVVVVFRSSRLEEEEVGGACADPSVGVVVVVVIARRFSLSVLVVGSVGVLPPPPPPKDAMNIETSGATLKYSRGSSLVPR